MRGICTGLFAVWLASGCTLSAPPQPLEEIAAAGGKSNDAQTATPRIVFPDEGAPRVEGTLRAGGAAVVRYDVDRLPGCRGTIGGRPAWSIAIHYLDDDGEFTTVGVSEGRDVTITLPRTRGELELYATVHNRSGCIAYDSNYGANHHFALAPAAARATLRFRADGGVDVDGTLRGGGELEVVYDAERLTTCRARQAGHDAWMLWAGFKTDVSGTRAKALTQLEGSDNAIVPALFAIPPSAHTVELWFENSDATGCRDWDSNGGSNHRFAVGPN
jgi:hypothetical protein